MKFNSRNVTISPFANIGNNVKIGDNTTIYDNVSIGDNSIICNDCIIGEPTNDYYDKINYVNPKTTIGENSLIRSHTIIYSDTHIGHDFQTGHRVTIREKSSIGNNCRIGTLSDLQGFLKIGNHCWLHSNVHIGQKSKIGNFVFIYPFVVLTNDPHPPSTVCIGPEIKDYAQIAVGSVILPGILIGEHALIGANSVVSKNVDSFQLVNGNPAKFIKDVREIQSRKTNSSHYPWPENFDRGMPWEGLDYKQWVKQNSND